jgi:DHA1 family tetracycline resistance protein-like MFS transporter
MLESLITARGNPRAAMYTEPLWGIPFNLYVPFASVYMLALGLTDATIGAIASVGLALQMVFSLLGGPITDKLGRKRTTFIFDTISWSIPALIWAAAQNAAWFYIAAIVNSLLRITMTSWTCLFIEDAPRDKVVHYWAWVHIAGILAGLVTPIAGLLIDRFTLVPTMRAIYLFAAISMTAKFIILNTTATETYRGKIRRAETADRSLLSLVAESLKILRLVFTTRGTLAATVVLLAQAIYTTVRGTFFAVLLTERLEFAPGEIGWFPALRSVVILLFIFVVIPRLRQDRHIGYLVTGLLLTVAGMVILVIAPVHGFIVVVVSTLVEAGGAAILAPYGESFVTAAVDPAERARILSVINTIVLAVSSPFGWISGLLSEAAKRLPFIMIIAILLLTALFLVVRNPETRGYWKEKYDNEKANPSWSNSR